MFINFVDKLLMSRCDRKTRAPPSSLGRLYSGVMVCELKPSILATGFRFVLAWLGLGAPWMERGSFIRLGSSFAGVRPVEPPISVGKRAEGGVAAAERHR